MKQSTHRQPKSRGAAESANLVRRSHPVGTADVGRLLQQAEIFDISQDAIFMWREPGGIELWNNGAADLYGFKAKEAVGRACHKLLRTGFPRPWKEIKEELRTQKSWQGELRHLTRDGRELVVSSRLQVIERSEKGMLVLESTRDVTEARRNEERLQARLREQAVAARFSLDALQAKDIQSICDDATHILVREMEVNFSSLFEVSADRKTMLLRSGAGWSPGYVGVTRIEVGEETATGRALQLNQPIIIEDVQTDRQLRVPDFARDHKVASTLAVVIEGRGNAFGVLGVDTTARRSFSPEDVHFLEAVANILATALSRLQFEHELRDTASRLRGIVDTAVDGIITIDERGMVETMNPAAERIFGYKADEVVGRNVSMLMPEPYHSEHDGYLERYRKTGERRIIGMDREVRGRRKDGTEFPMDLGVSATSLDTRRIFTGLVRDITARRRLEQEILEISDHEQRRIGHDLHDDLCQRLAGIRFSCDALKKIIRNAQPTAIGERLDKIAANVSEAIDRTRMLARGMAPVALETNGLVSALQELTHGVNTLSDVQCVFRGDETIAVKDPIAATHLYRITQEAINNALKHAHATRIVVSVQKADGSTVLTIEDNGDGFSAQEAQRTAEGMGLRTIAYRAGMIEASVEVLSAVGKGTKIICTFRSDL
ncbi:MAG: PAS domain S-box protein [Verrucomicrobiota bacterium]|nr:PAS domain S-box protein [Verrucomicrobiota bacterium]